MTFILDTHLSSLVYNDNKFLLIGDSTQVSCISVVRTLYSNRYQLQSVSKYHLGEFMLPEQPAKVQPTIRAILCEHCTMVLVIVNFLLF